MSKSSAKFILVSIACAFVVVILFRFWPPSEQPGAKSTAKAHRGASVIRIAHPLGEFIFPGTAGTRDFQLLVVPHSAAVPAGSVLVAFAGYHTEDHCVLLRGTREQARLIFKHDGREDVLAVGPPVGWDGRAFHIRRLGARIEVLAGPYAGIEIRNGLISGMLVDGIDGAQALGAVVRQIRVISSAGDGIVLGAAARVLEVSQGVCGGDGITVGNGSSIALSQAFGNAGRGIVSGAAIRVFESNAGANVGIGIETTLTSTIVDTGVSLNGGAGIDVGHASVIRGVSALGNQSDGIRTGCCSVVEHSVASSNVGDGIVGTTDVTIRGNNAVGNTGGGDGIQTGLGGNIVGNSVASNGGWGINPGDSSGFSKNVSRTNTSGDINTGPTRITAGDNVCSGVAC